MPSTDLNPKPTAPVQRMTTRSKSGIVKAKLPYTGIMCAQQEENSTGTGTSKYNTFSEPNSAEEALKIPQWKETMKVEFAALTRNKTWVLVPYNNNQSIVDCKWVFKAK